MIARMIRALPFLWLLGLLLASPLGAAPERYVLDRAASTVRFTYVLLGEPLQGTMPVSAAELTLDLVRLQNSRVRVELDATRTRTGLPLATEALTGPEILDVAAHPRIRFVSNRVTPTPDGARIDGTITIRDVSRPLTLSARIYRAAGSAEDDLTHLTILLTGAVDRRAFGASGYAEMVAARIFFDIRAVISRADS